MGIEIWAHRGAHGPALENTLPAFAAALAQGPDGIELDIQLSADGRALVFHDDELTRMTGGRDRRPLRGVTAATLRQIDLAGHTMPTLDEVLGLIEDRCPVNVEIKDGTALPEVTRILRRHRSHVLLSSFDHGSMVEARRCLPKVPRALVMGTGSMRLGVRFRESFPFWALRRADAVAWHANHALVGAPLVRALERLGVMTRVWTVNDAAQARALSAMGVHGVFTDRPGGLRADL